MYLDKIGVSGFSVFSYNFYMVCAQILFSPNPDKPEPKKIGFIFTTKITKEKKNKLYNLRALCVLRGVIKLFLSQNAQNLQLSN